MALPGNRDELNRMDEQAANRLSDSRMEEHHAIEDRRQPREQAERHRQGHDFRKDLHPERYPRDSLSRLEVGNIEDEQLGYSMEHRGHAVFDVESRVDD